MCLILFALHSHPEHKLIVSANRDEFYTRATAEAGFWDAEGLPDILAGRDLVAGGTWLGITSQGRFAAVTNIRDPSQLELKPRSRGELTRNFLSSQASAAEFTSALVESVDDYAGYNLLLFDGQEMYYANNLSRVVQRLAPGIYGLSNGELNSDWPKVNAGRAGLQAILQDGPAISTDKLLALVADRQPAPDAELPDTGVPLELERKLSSAFIHHPERLYGTRCSTAVLLSTGSQHRFSERNFNEAAQATSCHYVEFPANAA